jgi:zinc/manganese transport system substrate-binding protein
MLRGCSMGENEKSKMKNEKGLIQASALLLFLIFTMTLRAAPVKVVASTSDLAAIAQEIGGELISVQSLCRGDQDPHEFEILPNQAMLVQNADVFLKVGLALDLWADKLIAGANNTKLVAVDCSHGIAVIGGSHEAHDPHPEGNPHYWLGPTNWPVIAENIRAALVSADPADSAKFNSNFQVFTAKTDSALSHWRETLAACHGLKIVTPHASWDYFARDFGITVAGIVNRIPDMEPSPMDMARLEQTIRAQHAQVFLREPFSSDRIPTALTRDTGIAVMIAPSSVGATSQANTLWSQFDFLTRELATYCGK